MDGLGDVPPGNDMLCICTFSPAVGDAGMATVFVVTTAVVGAPVGGVDGGDPRDRFVEDRRRLRNGDRDVRMAPRIFCCVVGRVDGVVVCDCDCKSLVVVAVGSGGALAV